MTETWTNWSGGVVAEVQQLAAPSTEAELQRVVRDAAAAGLSVRVAGTGHSFTPVVATDGVIVSLDAMQGLVSANAATGRATLWGGTKLHYGTHLLWKAGLGLANQGDVDVQSVAGAIGTGTHGTGPAYGNIPSRLAGVRLVTADGEVRELTSEANPDEMRAVRVSLGMLGITSQATLACMPRYALHERRWRKPATECLDELASNIAANDHYEFFWYPLDDQTESKALNPVEDEPLEETPPPLEGPGERVGWSHRIYPSERTFKFNEMEYSVPAEAGPGCFREIRDLMRSEFPKWAWPVEYRTLAADDAFLSPAYERPTVTISVHQDARRAYAEEFRACEAVFRKYDGRPHWGKVHWQSRADLESLYPEWERFIEIRRQFDPQGRFLSPYLRPLFE
jgi:FAD/FMN-containing dehydrogenase